jgi:hypothetical protein
LTLAGGRGLPSALSLLAFGQEIDDHLSAAGLIAGAISSKYPRHEKGIAID